MRRAERKRNYSPKKQKADFSRLFSLLVLVGDWVSLLNTKVMNQTLNNSTLAILSAFEDFFGRHYTAPEKYFYVTLRRMFEQQKAKDGWVLLFDTSGSATRNRYEGFSSYGLSARVRKNARKKLKEDGLIETRYAHGRKGYRIGTEYRLIDDRLLRNPKAIHQAILGRADERLEDVSAGQSRGFEAFEGAEGCPQLVTG